MTDTTDKSECVKSLLFFDVMITPKIINFLYWLVLLLIVVGGLVSLFQGQVFVGLSVIVFGAIGWRIWCELLIVLFKIHENIKKLADK